MSGSGVSYWECMVSQIGLKQMVWLLPIHVRSLLRCVNLLLETVINLFTKVYDLLVRAGAFVPSLEDIPRFSQISRWHRAFFKARWILIGKKVMIGHRCLSLKIRTAGRWSSQNLKGKTKIFPTANELMQMIWLENRWKWRCLTSHARKECKEKAMFVLFTAFTGTWKEPENKQSGEPLGGRCNARETEVLRCSTDHEHQKGLITNYS